MANTLNKQVIKQCFYIIDKDQDSDLLNEDLSTLIDLDMPVMAVLDPSDNTHINIINVIKNLQEKSQLKLLLEKNNDLEKTYFKAQEYDKKLIVSGEYYQDENKAVYVGDHHVVFDIILNTNDPLEILSQIDIKKDTKQNVGFIISKEHYNISTLLLAFYEIEGEYLQTGSYQLEIENPNILYKTIANIGDITLAFFMVSILVFIVAIIVFKKWSQERFIK